jgi:hypothetical protein
MFLAIIILVVVFAALPEDSEVTPMYCGNDSVEVIAGKSTTIDEIRGEITPCFGLEIKI